MKSTTSQNFMILTYLTTHDGITGNDARNLFGCTRLPARIKDLEKQGHVFESEWDYSLNRFGNKVRFKRYKLVEE